MYWYINHISGDINDGFFNLIIDFMNFWMLLVVAIGLLNLFIL